MAKKQETKKEVEVPVVETPIVETPKPKKVEPKWEIKDRVYNLKGYKRPLSYMLRSSNIFYFSFQLFFVLVVLQPVEFQLPRLQLEVLLPQLFLFLFLP